MYRQGSWPTSQGLCLQQSGFSAPAEAVAATTRDHEQRINPIKQHMRALATTSGSTARVSLTILASVADAYVTLPKLQALERVSHDTADFVCSDIQLTIGMALLYPLRMLAGSPAGYYPRRPISEALRMHTTISRLHRTTLSRSGRDPLPAATAIVCIKGLATKVSPQ